MTFFVSTKTIIILYFYNKPTYETLFTFKNTRYNRGKLTLQLMLISRNKQTIYTINISWNNNNKIYKLLGGSFESYKNSSKRANTQISPQVIAINKVVKQKI